MKIAITGGTGFLGKHLIEHLENKEHELTVIARGLSNNSKFIEEKSIARKNLKYRPIGLLNQSKLEEVFSGVDTVAHMAGINREKEPGDFHRCHIESTKTVLAAAKACKVKKIVLVSYLNARPHIRSKYHQSKWEAEKLVKSSGIDYTIIKPGMIYGSGDHMITHITMALEISPFFSPVGIFNKKVNPVHISDTLTVLEEAILTNRLSGGTYGLVGPEPIPLDIVVSRIAKAQKKLSISVPMPVFFHLGLAKLCELTSKNPLVTTSQIEMLAEGIDDCIYGDSEQLPRDLQPKTYLTEETILAIIKD